MPNGTRPVSPCTTSTFSTVMPRRAATTCAKVVSWPWPWLCEPVNTVTRTQRARNVARRDAAGLDVAAVADAALQSLGRAGRFARLEPGHFGQRLRLVHAGVVVAHVVLQRHRRLVREAGDEVALADFILAQAQFPGTAADQAFQQV